MVDVFQDNKIFECHNIVLPSVLELMGIEFTKVPTPIFVLNYNIGNDNVDVVKIRNIIRDTFDEIDEILRNAIQLHVLDTPRYYLIDQGWRLPEDPEYLKSGPVMVRCWFKGIEEVPCNLSSISGREV